LEARYLFRDGARRRPITAVRAQAAQRRFDLQSTNVGNRDIPVISRGWGVGGSVGVSWTVSRRFAAHATVGRDWLFLGAYREIERTWNPTSADWQSRSFAVGFVFSPVR
jgi:hypothetical protein